NGTRNVSFHALSLHDALPIYERFLPERIGLTRQIVAFLAEALLDPVLADGTFRADFVAQEAENLRRRIEATINNKPQSAVNRLRSEEHTSELQSREKLLCRLL